MKKVTKNTASVEITKDTCVGQIFKAARTEVGKKIEDVASDLKIRKVYLESIEKSDYPSIPSYPYGVGFVKSYARYLGLDDVFMVDKFKAETTPKETFEIKEMSSKQEIFEAAIPSKKYIYIAVAGLVFVSVLWSLVSGGEDAVEKDLDTPASVIEAVEETSFVDDGLEQNVVVKEEVYIAQPEEVIEKLPAKEVSLDPVVKVFEETWIEVKTADKLYLSKVLNAGEEYKLPKVSGLVLSIGKINGADLFVGGVPMNVVKAGKKININLDAFLSKGDN